MFIAATALIAAQPAPEAQHLGVTVLIAVFAVLLTGLVGLAHEMRAETAHRP